MLDKQARADDDGEPPLRRETSFLLARSNALSLTMSNEALAPLDLRARSYSVLALACGTRPLSQRDLAAYLRLDPSQVVALVDGLQDRGLVERRAHPGDRRTNVVVGTAAGADLLSRARRRLETAEADLFGALDADEQRQLAALLGRIAFRA